MKLNVRFYGSLKHHLGSTNEFELSEEACVEDLRSLLARESPQVAAILAGSAFAVANRLVSGSTRLKSGDPVDVMPPFSGG